MTFVDDPKSPAARFHHPGKNLNLIWETVEFSDGEMILAMKGCRSELTSFAQLCCWLSATFRRTGSGTLSMSRFDFISRGDNEYVIKLEELTPAHVDSAASC